MLIILAAVTILAVQNTDLVGRAQNATIEYAEAQKKEAEDLENLDARLKNLTSRVVDTTGGTVGDEGRTELVEETSKSLQMNKSLA